MTKEFYKEETVIFHRWRCLECGSIIQTSDKRGIDQFILEHQHQTGHTKGYTKDEYSFSLLLMEYVRQR
jgi:hypothetical protein